MQGSAPYVQSQAFILRWIAPINWNSVRSSGIHGNMRRAITDNMHCLKAFGVPFYPDRRPTYAPGWVDQNAR
jgi:hypothetical protein